MTDNIITCPTCKGMGRVFPKATMRSMLLDGKLCPECQGHGKVRGTTKQVAEANADK